ncbi:biotin/lipoyl attachment domain-containing protein [Striga asiatica]|uniref:Biotin/lipoyl attachment domain-containing protein n=1 Tax=Striga asiatica TaxID=4170 RepID=A0A5A7QVD2_STRAF|nr:biotin/lipoyl attachment domain-containing protein [Striga asiatica]
MGEEYEDRVDDFVISLNPTNNFTLQSPSPTLTHLLSRRPFLEQLQTERWSLSNVENAMSKWKILRMKQFKPTGWTAERHSGKRVGRRLNGPKETAKLVQEKAEEKASQDKERAKNAQAQEKAKAKWAQA